MAIQRWDPVRELMQLRERLNRLFEETLSRSAAGAPATRGNGWQPPMDLHEESDRYVLRVDLPGVSPGDLEVAVEKRTLVLRGERKLDPTVAPEAYLRVERPHGRFAAQVSLPPTVDQRSIKAVHRGGVVEVILPKRRREETTGRITVDVE